MVANRILAPFDAANAAIFNTSATKQNQIIEFFIQQTSDTATITKDEAVSCLIIEETNHRSRRYLKKEEIKKEIKKIIRVVETHHKVEI